MKSLLIGVLAALALLVSASSASANGLCVGASSFCAAGSEFPLSADGLQAAVDAADSLSYTGEDFIYVAAGTIDLGGVAIDVDPPTGEPVTIIGAGVGKTIIHSTANSGTALNLDGNNADVALTGATIQVDGAQTTSRRAVYGRAIDLSSVKFELESEGGYSTEGFEGGGTCHNCEFAVSGIGAEAAYGAGNMTFYDSTAYSVGDPAGTSGFRQAGGGYVQLFSTTVSNLATGMTTDNGTLILTDSVIDMGDLPSARGVIADNANNGGVPLQLDDCRNRREPVGADGRRRIDEQPG